MGVTLSKSPTHEPVQEITINPFEPVLKLEVKTASISDRHFQYKDATITNWNSITTKIMWEVILKNTGHVNISVGLTNNRLNSNATIRVKLGDEEAVGKTIPSGGWDYIKKMPIGQIVIDKAGQYTLEVQAVTLAGLYVGNLVSVLLSGPAIKDAIEYVISPRANYIGFIWNKTDNCTWFYNSVKIIQTFPGTQFSVCGVDHIDVMLLHNDSGNGKYVMFSCLGQNANDADTDNRVIPNYGPPSVIYKDKVVRKRQFRTDQTGAHYSFTYPWKLNERYHILLKIDTTSWEDDVIFTAFFYVNETYTWKKIAAYKLSCERPDLISGMHSTIRDFYRRHGRFPREATFGPAWSRTADGNWKELNAVSFFQDGDENNVNAGIAKGDEGFLLVTGGFTKPNSSDILDLKYKGSHPLPDILKLLPD